MTFLHLLLALFAFAAADLMMSVLENRWHGARLLFLAPLPAAIIAGVFALTYVVVISVDRLERFYWTASLMLGVWVAGVFYCLVVMAVRKFFASPAPPPASAPDQKIS